VSSYPSQTVRITPSARLASTNLATGFSIDKQQDTLWCWAAVTSSLLRHFAQKPFKSQCAIASSEWDTQCCPAKINRRACNVKHSLRIVLDHTGQCRDYSDFPVSTAQIATELRLNRPVCIRIEWPNRGGHFVAIAGMSGQDGAEVLTVVDPLYPPWTGSRKALIGGGYQNKGGAWKNTYVVEP